MKTNPSLPKKKKVLIVEDEEVFLEAMTELFEKLGFEVTGSPNGKTAQELIGLNNFDLVVSDINMPNSMVGGVELLSHVKKHFPDVPVILMTGFVSIAETKEAHSLGAAGFLAKPFRRNDLETLLAKIFPPSQQTDESEKRAISDADYCKLDLDDFISGRQIKFTIYIRLSEGKFVKIAHEGEDLTTERIKSFKDKGIQFLYLEAEDFRKYLEQNLILTRAAQFNKKVPAAAKMKLIKHTSDVVMEHVFKTEFDVHTFEAARAVLDSAIGVLSSEQSTFDLLSVLNSHSDALYAHSLGVSLYATMIAKRLSWTSPQTLTKVSIAAMFHDIGKKEIPKEILDKPRAILTQEEVKLLETHPARGVEIMQSVPVFNTEILQIIQQHHENCIGTGYPLKLNKSRINAVARLVSVADEFCKLVITNNNGPAISPKEAVDRIQVLYREALDPMFVNALAEVIDPKGATKRSSFK